MAENKKGHYIFSIDKFILQEGKDCLEDNKWVYQCNNKTVEKGIIGNTIFVCPNDYLDKWCFFVED